MGLSCQTVWVRLAIELSVIPEHHPVSGKMTIGTGHLSRTWLCFLWWNKPVPRLCKPGRTPSLQGSTAVNFHLRILGEVGNYTQLSPASLLPPALGPVGLHLFSRGEMCRELWNASSCPVPGSSLFITCLLVVALDASTTLLLSEEIYLPQPSRAILENIKKSLELHNKWTDRQTNK